MTAAEQHFVGVEAQADQLTQIRAAAGVDHDRADDKGDAASLTLHVAHHRGHTSDRRLDSLGVP